MLFEPILAACAPIAGLDTAYDVELAVSALLGGAYAAADDDRDGAVARFSDALIELVLSDEIDREVAANAATNRHDFLVALEQALKRRAAGIEHDRPLSEMAAQPKPEPEPEDDDQMPELRIAGSQ